jgi:hypothetical protein
MSTELGRLEDLPADYRAALTQRNLVPLWPSLRGVLPPACAHAQDAVLRTGPMQGDASPCCCRPVN